MVDSNIPVSDECLAKWIDLKKNHKLRYVVYKVDGEKEVIFPIKNFSTKLIKGYC